MKKTNLFHKPNGEAMNPVSTGALFDNYITDSMMKLPSCLCFKKPRINYPG